MVMYRAKRWVFSLFWATG